MLGPDLKSLGSSKEQPVPDWLQVKPGRLRTMATGHGIKIGDTQEQVHRLMGKPTWQGLSKFTSGERVWSYHHKIGTDKDGKEYVSLFRFRRGTVTGIEIRYDLLGGG